MNFFNICGAFLIFAVLLLPKQEALAEPQQTLLNQTISIDKELNVTYQNILERLPNSQKEKFQRVQREWISYRDNLCYFEQELNKEKNNWIFQDTSGSKSLSCIHRLTQQRLTELNTHLSTINAATPDETDHVTKEGCKFVNLPEDFRVYAVGTYSGLQPNDAQLGKSGNAVKENKVIVNTPERPIILVLMAYDPVVWKVKRTAQSNILAVIVGGYHTQALLGLPKSIPTLFATYKEKGDCNAFYAYKAGKSLDQAVARIKEITGRELDHLLTKPTHGKYIVGDEEAVDLTNLIVSEERKIEDYTEKPPFPSGQRGLDQLVRQNAIRPATHYDIEQWVEKASKEYQKFNKELKVGHRMVVGRTYVILRDVQLPNGLFGGNSVAFLIPPGIPMPRGSKGHNAFYLVGSGTCLGPSCQR